MSKIVVTKCFSYEEVAVGKAMEKLMAELGGLDRFIQPGDRVLVKPNILEGVPPQRGVTTHPSVIRAVLKELKKIGAIPVIGDSPGLGNTLRAAKLAGILQVCQEEGVDLVSFKETMEISLPEGEMVKRLPVTCVLSDVDKVISLAKLKTHAFMGMTGGVKNLFGLICGMNKAQLHLRLKEHKDFAAMLVDLAVAVRPALYIVDAVVSMEGRGPRNGLLKETGFLAAGDNGFALDVVLTEIMGFSSPALPVTAEILRRGLSPAMEQLTVVGDGKDLRYQFKAPKTMGSLEGHFPPWLIGLFREQLTARPMISEKCIGCGRCAAHCPPKAIGMEARKAVINQKDCIRCYCCQELCPHDAVETEAGWMLRWLEKIMKKQTK